MDERLVRELATLSFVTDSANVIFLGPPGVGKTHLAVALGMKAIEAGFGVYFVRVHQLMEDLGDGVGATAILDRAAPQPRSQHPR